MNQEQYIAQWIDRNNQRQDGLITLDGVSIMSRRAVFCPDPTLTYSTAFLIELLPELRDRVCLDLGTGTGAIAVVSARRGAQRVLAVDIDPDAVRNARENVEALGLQRSVEVRQGDLGLGITERFDLITANLPILESVWEDKNISVSDTFTRFFQELPRLSNPNATILFSFASFGDLNALNLAMKHSNLAWIEHSVERFGVRWMTFIAENS